MSEQSAPFTVTVTRDVQITPGWGVWVDAIHDYDDDTDTELGVAEIDAEVVRIGPDTVRVMHGAPFVETERSNFPVDCFEHVSDLTSDDTHDLRSRWFATEEEAQAHAASVRATWDNPAPWQSFIRL